MSITKYIAPPKMPPNFSPKWSLGLNMSELPETGLIAAPILGGVHGAVAPKGRKIVHGLAATAGGVGGAFAGQFLGEAVGIGAGALVNLGLRAAGINAGAVPEQLFGALGSGYGGVAGSFYGAGKADDLASKFDPKPKGLSKEAIYDPRLVEYQQMMQQAQQLAQEKAGPRWNQQAHAAGVADAHKAYGAVVPGVKGPVAQTAQSQPVARPAIRPMPTKLPMAGLGRLVG